MEKMKNVKFQEDNKELEKTIEEVKKAGDALDPLFQQLTDFIYLLGGGENALRTSKYRQK